jgi:hypothetical protein
MFVSGPGLPRATAASLTPATIAAAYVSAAPRDWSRYDFCCVVILPTLPEVRTLMLLTHYCVVGLVRLALIEARRLLGVLACGVLCVAV